MFVEKEGEQENKSRRIYRHIWEGLVMSHRPSARLLDRFARFSFRGTFFLGVFLRLPLGACKSSNGINSDGKLWRR